jgi:hypothetical protein
MSDKTETTQTMEDDSELLLQKKLEKTRKTREAEKEASKEPMEEESKTQQDRPLTAEEEKDLAYAELEKMGCSRSYIARMKEKHGTVIVYPHEDNRWFLVRPLKVREMKMIREIAGQDMERLNKEILEAGCVFPMLSDEAVNDLPAGLPDLLTNMISRLSAFIPVELAFSLSKEL